MFGGSDEMQQIFRSCSVQSDVLPFKSKDGGRTMEGMVAEAVPGAEPADHGASGGGFGG